MAQTYDAIASTTGSGSSGSITFNSISTTNYTDLILVCDVKYASLGANTGYVILQVGNGSVDTGSNYSQTYVSGNGSTASSGRSSANTYFNAYTNVTGSNRAMFTVNLMNYSNTGVYKTCLFRTNESYSGVSASVQLWRSTSAINTIKVYDFSNYSFDTSATFTLYGVKSA